MSPGTKRDLSSAFISLLPTKPMGPYSPANRRDLAYDTLRRRVGTPTRPAQAGRITYRLRDTYARRYLVDLSHLESVRTKRRTYRGTSEYALFCCVPPHLRRLETV